MAEAIADLVIRIGTDVEVLKRDMAEASKASKKTADDISGSLGFIKGAFSALAASVSLQQIWSTFRSGVSELAALDDAAENAGTSVEKLGQLVADLAPSGVGVSQVSGMVQQLNRSLLTAETHTSRSAAAFKALNIETKDAQGNLKDSTELLREIAVALDKYADGTNKSQLATALLGRSGAQNIAVLKDLARTTGEANLYTSDMAAKAELLDKQLNLLNFRINQTKVALMSQLVPGLLLAIQHFKIASKEGLSFFQTLYGAPLAGMAGNLQVVRARLLENVEKEEKAAAQQQEAAQKEMDRLNRRDPTGVNPRYESERRAAQVDLDAAKERVRVARAQLEVNSQLVQMDVRMHMQKLGLPYDEEPGGTDPAPVLPDEGAAAKSAREAMQVSMEKIANDRKRATDKYKESLAEVKYLTEMGLASEEEALRERQRLEAEHLSAMVGFYNQEIAIKQRADAKARDQSGILRAQNERQAVIDQLLGLDTRYARELEVAWRKSSDAIQKASVSSRNAETQNLNALQQANIALAAGNEARIKSIVTGRELAEVEREVAIARLESELALDERPDPNKVRRLELLREELALYRQRAAIEAQATRQKTDSATDDKIGIKAVETFEERAKKAAETIHDALTNALLRGFEDGKGIAENFRDTLKNMFLTMVLRPVIEPIMKPVADIAGNIVSAIVQAATGGITGSMLGGTAAPIEARTFPQPRAAGGPVIPGGTYLVGEEGPEVLRMGSRGGYVSPNGGGRAPVQINQTFNIGAGVDASTAQSIWMASKEAAKAEIADANARTGRGLF